MTDDWQRRGLGTVLLEVAGARAREEGITTFTALLLASNQEMLDLLQSLGPVRVVDRERATVEIEMPIPEAGVSPALRKLLRVAARHDLAVPIAGPNGLLRLAPAPDHRRERRRLINPRRPGGTGLCGARPCRARRGLRRASSCRLASIPPPIPVAARPAAISPGLARRRPYSSTTAGHTRSSINSETGSASSHPGPGTTAGRKATYTRLNLYQWVAPRAWHTEMLLSAG